MTSANLAIELAVYRMKAIVNDLVLLQSHSEESGFSINRVTGVKGKFFIKIEGSDSWIHRNKLSNPSMYNKQMYYLNIRKKSTVIILPQPMEFVLSIYPNRYFPSDSVVGRPDLHISEINIVRTPSNYVDIQFSILNTGDTAAQLSEYHYEDFFEDIRMIPFSYCNDIRLKVFQIYNINKDTIFPTENARVRVAISGWTDSGIIVLYIPSGLLGGAVGTYTMIRAIVPEKLNLQR